MNCIFNCGEGGITNVVSQARLEPSARVLIPPKEMGIKKTLSGFCFIFNCGEGGITSWSRKLGSNPLLGFLSLLGKFVA